MSLRVAFGRSMSAEILVGFGESTSEEFLMRKPFVTAKLYRVEYGFKLIHIGQGRSDRIAHLFFVPELKRTNIVLRLVQQRTDCHRSFCLVIETSDRHLRQLQATLGRHSEKRRSSLENIWVSVE